MKIIVRMMGGLGNQIFIYAFARKLQVEYPDAEILLDLRDYKKRNLRKFELDKFRLNKNVKIMTQNDISKISFILYDISRNIFRILVKLFHYKIECFFLPLSRIGYCYNYQSFRKIKIPKKKKVFVYGYFQDYRYIEAVKHFLVEELVLIDEGEIYKKYLRLIEQNDCCALSVRAGSDYIKLGWPICKSEYFINGIMYIQSQKKINVLVVFSDVIEQVKRSQIKDANVSNIIYIENLSPCEGLSLLMKCHDFVISNSSFSWLGAILGKKEETMIVVPEQWFAHKKIYETKLYCEDMIIME